MIEIKNFKKIYDKTKVAVDDLTLTINDGDLFGFIGHNGAGKSTTIKAIIGLSDITSGDIIVNGISVKENSLEVKKQIGYVPDNPDLYDSLTGSQYLNFICDIFNVDVNVRKERIEKYAKELELDTHLGEYISTFSHGMKQKLSIIAALIHEPKVLILDEPFVGLDPLASHKVKTLMKEFCDKGNIIFFSTHVLEVAEKLCNKIAIIKAGKLVITDTVENVTKNSSLEDVFMELEEHA